MYVRFESSQGNAVSRVITLNIPARSFDPWPAYCRLFGPPIVLHARDPFDIKWSRIRIVNTNIGRDLVGSCYCKRERIYLSDLFYSILQNLVVVGVIDYPTITPNQIGVGVGWATIRLPQQYGFHTEIGKAFTPNAVRLDCIPR